MNILKDKRIISILWTVVRIWLGWQWLTAGWHKLTDAKGAWVGATAGASIQKYLSGVVAKAGLDPKAPLAAGAKPSVQEWYGHFIQNFALPNYLGFSYVITFGEILVGLGLILGCLTTIALCGGILMNMNFLLAGSTSSNPNDLFVAFILLLVGANVYYYGADRFVWPYLAKLRANKAAKPVSR